jgi:hypothetical protein
LVRPVVVTVSTAVVASESGYERLHLITVDCPEPQALAVNEDNSFVSHAMRE